MENSVNINNSAGNDGMKNDAAPTTPPPFLS
jgi:hypothetical protein